MMVRSAMEILQRKINDDSTPLQKLLMPSQESMPVEGAHISSDAIRPSATPSARLTTVHFSLLKPYAARRVTLTPTRSKYPSAESLGIAEAVEVPVHCGLAYIKGHH